jgi:hypothetical protein
MININFNDSTFILTSAFLWVTFGLLGGIVGCDIQKLLSTNLLVRHTAGVLIFFFLFAIVGNNDSQHILYIWIKTIILYILFILLSKSKWYFSFVVILLLLLDQSIAIQNKYKLNINKKIDETNTNLIRKIIRYSIFIIIIIGFLSYLIRQYNEFQGNFDITKLLFDYKCSN